MVASSTLFSSASGGRNYGKGEFVPVAHLNNVNGATITANRDYLWPFSPQRDVTVGEVAYRRVATTAGNVYVGIYDEDGNLLTDCTVDSDTTAGIHAVSTTPVLLNGGGFYWMAANASAAVINGDTVLSADDEPWPFFWNWGFFLDAGMDGSSYQNRALYKTRSNAALSDPLTISGFTQNNFVAQIGIIKA